MVVAVLTQRLAQLAGPRLHVADVHTQQVVHLGGRQVGGVRPEVLDLPPAALQQPVGREPRQA